MGSYRVGGPFTLAWATTTTLTAPMSGTSVVTSQPIDISNYESTSIQPVWTGTPTGTLKVLVSNDGTNYTDIGATIPTQPAGSASSTFIPLYATCAKWMKLQYTNASGSGTLSAVGLSKTR